MGSSAQLLRVASVVVGALLVLPARGQSPDAVPKELQQQTYSLRVEAKLVVLDVMVTNRSGQIRPNLAKEDFKITENGVPQTILSFEPPSTHATPAGNPIHSTAELEARAPQSSVNIIVLDELNTSFADMGYARYALKKYLNAHGDLAQSPTTMLAVSFDRLTVLNDYTQDSNAILSALDHHLAQYPWNLARGEDKIVNFAKSLGTLEQVAMATAGHPGHKNIIWVGKGFPGIDLNAPSVTPNASAAVTYAMEQAVNILRDSRITLYLVDPTALSSTTSTTVDDDSVPGMADGTIDNSAPDPFAGSVSFGGLAKVTGGRSFYNRNDVDQEFAESVRDGASYYTIAYRPTDQSDAQKTYRKIRVFFRVPDLKAGYRDGYFSGDGTGVAASGPRLKYDLESAELSTMVYTGLDVVAAAKPGAPGTYLVGVPERELAWSQDGDTESTKVTVVVAAINRQGEVIRRASTDVTARRGSSSAIGSQSLVKVEIALPDGPNTQRLRFVVRGERNERLGTADLAPSARSQHP